MAIPLAVIIILLTPPLFQQYEVNLTEHDNLKPNAYVHYFDINNDGVVERISEFDTKLVGSAALYIEREGSLIDQYNFNGVFFKRNDFSVEFDDYDSNGIHEIYFVTRRADSAFLNIFSLNENDKVTIKKEIFLDKLSKAQRDIYDFKGGIRHFKDLNQDGYKEIFLFIQGYYSKLPRKVFIYDHGNDQLKKSRNFAGKVNIKDSYHIDNKPRILVKTKSSANIPDTVKAIGSDYKEQLFILDTSLKVVKGPVNFGEYHSKKGVFTFDEPGYKIKTHCIKDEKINDTLYADIREYDKHLTLMEKNNVPLPFNYDNINDIRWINKQPILRTHKGGYKILPEKKVINEKHVYKSSEHFKTHINIDEHPEDEIILINQNNKVIILGNDFKKNTSFDCPIANNEEVTISKIPAAKHQNRFMIQNKEKSLIYSYETNPYYQWQYPFYAGIYLLLVGFLHLIVRFTRSSLNKKYQTEHEIRRLQILSTRSQTSPHFTYNLLNSLSSAIIREDRTKAQKMISKLATLMRRSLDSSEAVERTLEEELDFINIYLGLETERFSNLDFAINIDKNVNMNITVPKMLIHIFVENAIKHGIKHLQNSEGFVGINVTTENDGILVSVMDNGIGRRAAKKYSKDSSGQGLPIVNKLTTLYEELNNCKIDYRFFDLYNDNQQPAGTKVLIHIPQKAQKIWNTTTQQSSSTTKREPGTF
ncbi:MAG: histidine kinase [Bacteroidales bacterium]|nr:histidine kinase [Bacteroidales bacterium]